MSQVTIQEIRKLVLSLETLLEIVIDFDRANGGSLWKSSIELVEILKGSEMGLAVTVATPGSTAPEIRKFDYAKLAAATIHYCRKARIPLPKNGTKTLEVVPQGIAFTVEVMLMLPARYDTRKAVEEALRRSMVPEPKAEPPPAEPAPAAESASPAESESKPENEAVPPDGGTEDAAGSTAQATAEQAAG